MGRMVSVVVAGILLWAAGVQAGDKTRGPHVPKGWQFAMPAGDPEAGMAAFERMQCYSCHKVPGVDLPQVRSSGGVGPDLVTGYSKLPAGFLAESIINSHQYISGTLERYRGLDKVSSKMGDYSSVMTVRDLIDIVAFLKHLGAPPVGAEHRR